jgi:hypothetical protein
MLVILCVCALMLVASTPKELRLDALRSHKGFSWKLDHSANFDFFFEPGSPAESDIDKIKATMERMRQRSLEMLGEQETEFRTQAFMVDSIAHEAALRQGIECLGCWHGVCVRLWKYESGHRSS